MSEEASKALWGKCPSCGHCWAAAYYPLTLRSFATIAKNHSTCPKCGAAGRLAKQRDGVLLEPSA